MKKIVALFMIFVMLFSLAACNSKNKICSECKEKLVGDWFCLKEFYSDENYVYELHKFSITEDGKFVVGSDEYEIHFEKCGNFHHNRCAIVDDDGSLVYELAHNFYSEDPYIETDSISIYSKVDDDLYMDCRSMNKYSVVEITEENWQEYFSPNFKENFDVNYTIDADKDAWGEVTSAWISEEFTVKNIEKYAYGSSVTLEYSYEVGRMKYDFDASENKVINTSYTSSDATIHKETSLLQCCVYSVDERTTHMDMKINGERVYKEDISKGTCDEEVHKNPIEILRMKGYLIIKNDN